MVVSIKWLDHASFQIKSGGKVIYIDLAGDAEASEKADLVLVTHSHPDHFDPAKIKKVSKSSTITIAPKDCVPNLGGKPNIVKTGDDVRLGDIAVKAVEAYNYKRFRSPGVPFHPQGQGVGYVVTIGDKRIYHAGDTDFIPEMRRLKNVDMALLPTGDKYTMDNSEAAEAAIAIKPKTAMAMHTWETDREEFKKKVEAKSRIKVVLLQEGEEYELN